MGIIRDTLPIFRTTRLEFVKRVREGGDVTSFCFRRPEELTWKAGQHGLFTFPERRIRGRSYRVFSIASSPLDETLRIATRIREPMSAFKRHLVELRAGEGLSMRGPIGPFYIHDPSRPVVLVATGIGITPFLGMVADLRTNRRVLPESVDLVYGVWGDAFPFRSELEEAVEELPGFAVFPRVAAEEVRGCAREMASLRKNDGHYFLSGELRAVRSLRRMWRENGIARSNILSDWFLGYGSSEGGRGGDRETDRAA